MRNPYWLEELIWTFVILQEQVRIGMQMLKRKMKKFIWYLRGEPTLEQDLRDMNRDYMKMKRELREFENE